MKLSLKNKWERRNNEWNIAITFGNSIQALFKRTSGRHVTALGRMNTRDLLHAFARFALLVFSHAKWCNNKEYFDHSLSVYFCDCDRTQVETLLRQSRTVAACIVAVVRNTTAAYSVTTAFNPTTVSRYSTLVYFHVHNRGLDQPPLQFLGLAALNAWYHAALLHPCLTESKKRNLDKETGLLLKSHYRSLLA